jgi:hypothetical protein
MMPIPVIICGNYQGLMNKNGQGTYLQRALGLDKESDKQSQQINISSNKSKMKIKRYGESFYLMDTIKDERISELFSEKVARTKTLKKKIMVGFQGGSEREEAESVPPIVKSWRDAGDTPCRQNHREEAKLLTHPHLQPVQSISTSR